MPTKDVEERGGGAEAYEGVSRESLDHAIRLAVDAAGQRHGTWLTITRMQVLSVDDPNVGAYRVIVTPGG